VYEHKCHKNGRSIGVHSLNSSSSSSNNNNNNHDFYNTSRLAIHELCKMTTSPTSVRFSKDEISDDEEEDDDSYEDDSAEELDQIFDACELEEGTKMYEVAQFMIDVSHSMGPIRVASPCDDDENDNNNNSSNNNNNNDLSPIEERRRGIERNEPGGSGNDEDDESRNDRQQEQAENDEKSRSHTNGSDGFTIHESILTCADSTGKTPLHVLCEHSCDSNMMRVILGSTREATGNPRAPSALSLILAKDSRGSTPLHYLVYSRQCPFSSLKLMMEYCKPCASGNENGQRRSRWIDPTLCTDDDGETPLHWALAGYVSSRRIKELTRHSVDAIMVQNEKGERPFDQFTTNFVDSDWTDHDVCGNEVWENIQEYLKVIHENQINHQYRSAPDDHHQQRMSGCDNDDGDNSNQEENGDSVGCNDSEWLPLHFLSGCVYDFPPIFTDLAMKYCSDELRKADANGMLPLHLACGRQSAGISNNLGSKSNNETTTSTKKVRNTTTDSVAMRILKKCQRASLIQVASTKRLALHLALETQKPLSLITALIRTNPRSLNIPDPVTKLWPYVLAGVRHSYDENSNNVSLSVSFALLRADPSVLHLVQKNERVSNHTERFTTDRTLDEESTLAEESYTEHSSRRIRRLTIRDD
jgi:hypothetical protein